MSQSKLLRLLLTTGKNEEVLAVLVREIQPGSDGEVKPPELIENKGKQYVLKRQWAPNMYVYSPSKRRQIDDFLGNEPV